MRKAGWNRTQFIWARCIAASVVPVAVWPLYEEENNGGIKDELANYSILCLLFCISE